MEVVITLKDIEDSLCIAIKKAIAENKEGDDISSAIEDNFYDIDPSGDRVILTDFIYGCLYEDRKVVYTDIVKGYQILEGKLLIGKTVDGKKVYLKYRSTNDLYNDDGLWSEFWNGHETYLTYTVREPKRYGAKKHSRLD